ncbi:KH domain-containing protein, partial [Pseudomonas koreensis]|uniref:KH domain-containing protein n=1 Tax=Pseudomonas koreensis TaxID=198620 RepID=UPI00380FA171
KIIGQSRTELSAKAPTMIAMKIDTEKIRDVIGKGGATIRAICEETKASIDIEDDGSIKIFGETKDAAEAARQRVLSITAEAEIGKIYVGKVERIVDFGAFVNILPGKDGLVHISMLSDARVEKVT